MKKSKSQVFYPSIYNQVQEGNLTHGLFPHGTLIRVSWGLVMVRVWDEASTDTKQSEGLNLQVGGISVKLIKNQTSQTPGTRINLLKVIKKYRHQGPQRT